MPPRRLTAAESDALLCELADAAVDQSAILARMEQRQIQIERQAGSSPMAILRESVAAILADRVKTASAFAFATVLVLAGAAVYLGSESALIAVATQGRADPALPATHTTHPDPEPTP
jgi:hypothetical protein